MKEQTHYYLIGNEIKKGTIEPSLPSFANYDIWLNSLQPCSIKHRELGELIKYVSENNANIDFYNPIEVTDIIEKDCKSECHLSLSKKCICPDYRFKQPKSEANEALQKSHDELLKIAFLVGAVIVGFSIVEEDKEFKFKGLCPYCQGDLTYRCNGWEQDENGLWMADSFDIECSTEPDMESEEWEDWMDNHSDMPYVNQLPVDERVKASINKRYRFDVR